MNSIKKLTMFAVTCAALTVLNSKVETKASMTTDNYTLNSENTNKSNNDNNNILENNNNNNIKEADSNYSSPSLSSSTSDNLTSTDSNSSKTSSTNNTKKSDTALTTKDTFNNEFDKIERKANDSIKQQLLLPRNMLEQFFNDIDFSGSDNEKSESRSVNESSYTDENGNKNTTKIIRQSRRKTETDKDGAINEIVETKTVRKTSLTQEDKNS